MILHMTLAIWLKFLFPGFTKNSSSQYTLYSNMGNSGGHTVRSWHVKILHLTAKQLVAAAGAAAADPAAAAVMLISAAAWLFCV